tara:strand:+ start:108 stop:758 length:651 start_codon:yes stop_codon:yes gene_type:complete
MENKIKNLQEPLSTNDIEFRVQSINKGGYATILAYKNARVDMQRLDDVVGALNWKREHTRDNANCIVSIRDDATGQWVSKEDTGTESSAEAKKGLASDSFKRACFNWGIGRELYDYPIISAKLNSDEFDSSSGKAKQTWNLKLREWEWQVQFDKKTVTKITAKDQNGKERYLFGKDTLTTNHENYDKVKSFIKGGGDIKEVEKKYILSDEIKKELK